MSIRIHTRNGHVSVLAKITILVAPNELGPSPDEVVHMAAHYGVEVSVNEYAGDKFPLGIYLVFTSPDGSPYIVRSSKADVAEIRSVVDGAKHTNEN